MERTIDSWPFTCEVARPQDAESWLKLRYLAQDQPLPDIMVDQVKDFLSVEPDVAKNRFLGWIGDEPMACWTLYQLENVVELRDFFIVDTYLMVCGTQVLEQVIKLARHIGTVITVDRYPRTYQEIFLEAGFKQNVRTRMIRSLETHQIQIISLPAGLQLRHPRPDDEEAVVELTYGNYFATIEHGMVCSSKAQAAAMVRGIFGQGYCRFDLDSSFLVEDEQHRLIGNIFVGDMSTHEIERLAWIVDISVAQAWRGKGLGRALMVSGLNAARLKRYANIGLTVSTGNEVAVALYSSSGFGEYGPVMYEAILDLAN